jgi:hypothetical protein
LRKLFGGIPDGFVFLAIEIPEFGNTSMVCASDTDGYLVHHSEFRGVFIYNLMRSALSSAHSLDSKGYFAMR